MRRLRSIMGAIATSANGFVHSAAPTGGTPMTLASNTPTAAATGQIHTQAVPILITASTGTVGGTFTVVGLDRRGNPQTEIIPAPAAESETSSGHFLFSYVSSITPSETKTADITIGWSDTNYGPWLVSAYQPAGYIASLLSGSGDLAVYGTTMNLLDPEYFMPQGQGNNPLNDQQFGDTGISLSGPYLDTLPWPLVPAALQAAAPQLLSQAGCLPEDDGTYSGAQILQTTAFTASAVGAAANATAVRGDPTVFFAYRLVIPGGTAAIVQLDVNPGRRW